VNHEHFGRLIYKTKGKGKIYEGGRFLMNVEYNLSQYEQIARSRSVGFISQQPKTIKTIEAYLTADDTSALYEQDVTLELADGRQVDGSAKPHSTGLALFLSQKDFYQPI
jgi:hypothetical protein